MTRFSVTSSQGVTGKNMLMTVAEVSLTSDNWTKEDEVVMNSCCTLDVDKLSPQMNSTCKKTRNPGISVFYPKMFKSCSRKNPHAAGIGFVL